MNLQIRFQPHSVRIYVHAGSGTNLEAGRRDKSQLPTKVIDKPDSKNQSRTANFKVQWEKLLPNRV